MLFVKVVVPHCPYADKRARGRDDNERSSETCQRLIGLRSDGLVESNERQNETAQEACECSAEFHHPPVDRTEQSLAPLEGFEFIQVTDVGSHRHHDGEQTANTEDE